MFAGHTHGFQFGVEIGNFKWSPAQYAYKQWAGLYREAEQYLYVNRGFGFIGYPGRIGILPEIANPKAVPSIFCSAIPKLKNLSGNGFLRVGLQ